MLNATEDVSTTITSAPVQAEYGMVDKSQRSVFVGNIPYEATEEKLKEIFSEVGPVTTFKLVYDRENGKPKGYGFCEYQDVATALSAMRNLNGYEVGGRALRVDTASTDRTRADGLSGVSGVGAPGQQLQDSPYGNTVEPEKVPESISKAVASLPPEQMFELMKQMKMCIQSNPQEARNMLNQNPQLAYALLQAMVVMRILDPENALNMLHRAPPRALGIQNNDNMTPVPVPAPSTAVSSQNNIQDIHRNSYNIPQNQGIPQPPMSMDRGGAYVRREDPRFNSRDPRRPFERDQQSQNSSSLRHTGGLGSGNVMPPGLPPHLAGADPEKAQLIMQVLQLTDEQIAVLPEDQKMSIMELKRQINKQ